jgi:colicin import membrane protein
MKRLWNLLRLAALGPFILLMGAEGDDAAAKAAADAAAKKAADEAAAAAKKAAEDEAAKKPVTMTQAELDALIEKRLARGSKSAVEEYLKGLGKSKEEIEALIKANTEAEEKAKTDLQKAQEKAAKAEAEKQSAITAANAKLARAAFMVQATLAGIAPACVEDAAILAATQLADLKPDEKTGDFKAEDVKTIAEELLKAKPWLKGDGKSGNVGGPSNQQGDIKPGDIGAKYAKDRAEANKVENDPWAAPKA